MQVQHRFTIPVTVPANDRTRVRFVFGPNGSDPDELPSRTTLERAIIDQIKAGRHWHAGIGWLTL